MANLPDSPSFDDVYQLEQTDPVDAGENGEGIANAQARNLANRTRYLKDAHEALDASLKPVAKSGNYADLTGKPALGSAATADASDFATAAQGAKADAALPASEKGAANGVASLDATGKVPAAQLPPVTSVSLYEVANEAALFALTATKGDIARRQDSGLTYMHRGTGFGDIRDWLKLSPDLPDVDVAEAPIDGLAYLRKNGEWVAYSAPQFDPESYDPNEDFPMDELPAPSHETEYSFSMDIGSNPSTAGFSDGTGGSDVFGSLSPAPADNFGTFHGIWWNKGQPQQGAMVAATSQFAATLRLTIADTARVLTYAGELEAGVHGWMNSDAYSAPELWPESGTVTGKIEILT